VTALYAHFKAVSGFEGRFTLKAGFPLKVLSNPNGTVHSEQLKGAKIVQIEGIDGLPLSQKKATSAPPSDSIQSEAPKKREIAAKRGNENDRNEAVPIKAVKMKCNALKPTTKIQILLIGGKRETVTVNLTATMLELYGHVKAVSGFDGRFTLNVGRPPKALNDPEATMESAGLRMERVQQQKGGHGLIRKMVAPESRKWTMADLDRIEGVKIECDGSKPSTTILIVLSGGKSERVTVNLSSSILEIYAHCKAVSGLDDFKLVSGMPSKELVDLEATVESAGLKGTKIIQKMTRK